MVISYILGIWVGLILYTEFLKKYDANVSVHTRAQTICVLSDPLGHLLPSEPNKKEVK